MTSQNSKHLVQLRELDKREQFSIKQDKIVVLKG